MSESELTTSEITRQFNDGLKFWGLKWLKASSIDSDDTLGKPLRLFRLQPRISPGHNWVIMVSSCFALVCEIVSPDSLDPRGLEICWTGFPGASDPSRLHAAT